MKKLNPTPIPAMARWSAAVAAGLTLIGCPDKSPQGEALKKESSAVSSPVTEAPGKDKACCMGKNDCKGKGGCAVPESNACAGKNECKGRGGCNMHCPK